MSSDKSLNLANLFQTVTQALQGKQSELNEADGHNHDHGDNMVKIFEVISGAMKKKAGASASDQLEYASQTLSGKSQSGSAKLYSSGLAQAAQLFQGKNVTAGNAMQLIQSLMGGGTAPPKPQATSNPLGSLLSGLVGGGKQDDDGGLDVNDLLSAGMAFLSSKKSGKSDMNSIVSAIVAGSQMSSSPYRSQSSSLVTSTLLNVISSFTG